MKSLPALFLILFVCAVKPVAARALHVGSSEPYANIEAAAAAALPGDSIFVHAGSYGAYQYIPNLHGAPSQWIVIVRYGSGAMDISGMWQFSQCSYLKFSKLTFRANAAQPGRLFHIDNGGSCATQSHHIVVDSCSFLDVADPANSALKFGGVDTFTVSNCVFENIAAGAFDFNACHVGSIVGNRIENCATGGHIKGGASFITMERNLFLNASTPSWVAFEFGGDTGAQFYCPGSAAEVNDLKFWSNIVAGGYRGLALSSAFRCDVANNTFYECGQATMRFLTTSTLFPVLSGNTVRNNIFAFGAASQYINGSPQSVGAVTFQGNIYCSTVAQNFSGPYWDTPELDPIKDPSPLIFGSATPMFVNGSTGDFHLAAGSPAIAGAVAATEPSIDYYGNAFSSPRAIGAVESASATSVPNVAPSSPSMLSVYPNPADEYIDIIHRLEPVSAAEPRVVEICNPLGMPVLHLALSDDFSTRNASQRIFLGALPVGMYFVRAGNRTARFVKAPELGR